MRNFQIVVTLAKNQALLCEVVVRVLLKEDLASRLLTPTDPLIANLKPQQKLFSTSFSVIVGKHQCNLIILTR